jgi:endonuclease-8
MNGRWRIAPRGTWRRGLPWLVLSGGAWEATQWNGPVLSLEQRAIGRLGPDLLSDGVDVSEVVARLRRTSPARLVGEALVDQRIVAGIGNMWLAEMLWSARLSPWRRLGEASDAELASALGWARAAMRASVGGQRHRRVVHRRAGRPCPRCGTPIESRGLGDASRTAYWCPRCQPAGADRGGRAEEEGLESSGDLQPQPASAISADVPL